MVSSASIVKCCMFIPETKMLSQHRVCKTIEFVKICLLI